MTKAGASASSELSSGVPHSMPMSAWRRFPAGIAMYVSQVNGWHL
jgi:hypothetical protein